MTSLAACARSASSDASGSPTPVATAVVESATAEPAPATASTAATAPPASRAAKQAVSLVAKAPVARVAAPTLPSAVATNVTAAPTPANGPQIYSVATAPTVVHNGETVTWNVRTSTDVIAVTAHVSAYTFPLALQSPGHFFLGFTIPSTVPSIFHGTYNLELTARTQSGSSAKRNVPMVFQ